MSDLGQAEQLSQEFQQLSSPQVQEYNYVYLDQGQSNTEAVQTIYSKISKDECNIILSIGYRSLEVIKMFKKDPKYADNKDKIYVFWGGQQFFEQLNDADQLGIDYLLLPSFVQNKPEIKALKRKVDKISTIFGVATKVPNQYERKQKYTKWNSVGCGFGQKPSLDKKYIIISLPGDIEEGDKRINRFTKESADKLFDSVFELWKKTGAEVELLIQNSPRTGRFDENNEVSCSHEFKAGNLPPMDHITEHFIKKVSMNRVPYRLFNFGFEIQEGRRKKPCSVSEALLHVAENTDSYYIIPGDSLSYISQLTQILKPERILVFQSSSMNEYNHELLSSALGKGYLSVLKENGEIAKPEKFVQRSNDSLTKIVENIIKYATKRCMGIKKSIRSDGN